MRSRHDGEIYWVAIGMGSQGTIALIVAKAVLDSNNNPRLKSVGLLNYGALSAMRNTYHRFVKTTPKPSATKNSSGELELLGLELLLGVGEDDADDEAVGVAIVSQRGVRNSKGQVELGLAMFG